MTEIEARELKAGDKVRVLDSGKVYKVLSPAKHIGTIEENKAKAEAEGRSWWTGTRGGDGWGTPSYVQWQTDNPKFPQGREYGPVRNLKPENIDRLTQKEEE